MVAKKWKGDYCKVLAVAGKSQIPPGTIIKKRAMKKKEEKRRPADSGNGNRKDFRRVLICPGKAGTGKITNTKTKLCERGEKDTGSYSQGATPNVQ